MRASHTRRCSEFKTWNLTELFVRGGTVYGPDGPRDADVHVSDGVITEVEAGGATPAKATGIEARGMYVLPGAIDVHVHSPDPGLPEEEDFGTLTAPPPTGAASPAV